MSDILWTPSPQRIAGSHIARFMEEIPIEAESYQDLWEWSITERGAFWEAVWRHGDVVASQQPERPIGKEAMPGTEWFPGARLNFAENLLRTGGDAPALIVAGEDRDTARISWDELRTFVARAQRGLVAAGVGPGDRVASLIHNGPEAVVAMLATVAIGAVWSSCSPEFGPTGVVDRFGQIDPRVLITVDGYRYNGAPHEVAPTVRATLDALPGLSRLVVIDRVDAALDTEGVETISWHDLLDDEATEPVYAQLPFDHPLYILYSSGTTGLPKSIVHGAGGTLLKHISEHQLHCDVRPGDRVFWYTTCGWMMWNWLVSALGAGAAAVLYDGSPSHPDLGRLWRLVEEAGVTHFGTSPKFLAANENAGLVPGDEADLSTMRWLGSTGAPLNPEQFDWVYEHVKSDLHLASISGGTDIVGCFAAGVPILPVRRGELQARVLGMAVEAWDVDGEPVVGEKGELVCTAPFVSMPVSFWNDPQGERYHAAYFDEYPGVWTHGDFIEIRDGGGVVIYGRSDTTLNRGGVRIGTAEIYRAVEPMPEVEDAIAVGRSTGSDVEVLLFVKTVKGTVLDDALAAQISTRIRGEASPRHVPDRILPIDDIPYTLSGKKVEKAVRTVLEGDEPKNRDALKNPEALAAFERYASR
jgi:acetoacetyl-CoA synthetase